MSGWNELKKTIIDQDLCSLCGTCVGVCPVRTLSFDHLYETIYDSAGNCINCSKCLQCCPGGEFDYEAMNQLLFSKSGAEINYDIGAFTEILRAQSTNSGILKSSSSGGVATEIGKYMLENCLVDYVIGIVGDYPVYTAAAISSSSELKKTMQSKYLFIPTNEIISFVLQNKGRYLYIGLPCQIQGLRKACLKNKLLAERIELCVSIFCGFNMEREATELLIRKSKIPRDTIKKIEYRATRGDQTGFCIRGETQEFFLSKHGYTMLNAFYARKRCWKCYDLTGEFSDISLGDAWEKKHGWSRIIVRTDKGKRLIEDMRKHGNLCCEDSCVEDIYETQKQLIFYKKKSISTRKKLLHTFPKYNIQYSSSSLISTIKAIMFLMIMEVGHTKLFRKILQLCPIKILEKLSQTLRNGTMEEIVKYGFWGVVTVLTSFFSYWLLIQVGLDYKAANLAAIIITKITAYLSNKFFVFHSKCDTIGQLLKECVNFIIARGASAIVEMLGLILLVDYFSFDMYVGKGLLIIITTILNYVFGKNFVYTAKRQQ